jgi:hypothetical protein
MQPIPGHDRWLDPPDEPTHGECSVCREVKDYSDMYSCGFSQDTEVCDDCMTDLAGRFPAEQRAEVERIIKRYGVTTTEEIKEYLESNS